MLQPHWGDLPVIPDTESGIAAIEREQITKPRPVEVEGAKLYQPVALETHLLPKLQNEFDVQKPQKVEQFLPDSIAMHTIRLTQHVKKVKALLQTAQQQQENIKGEKDGGQNLPSAPPIPELAECILKHRRPGSIKEKDRDSNRFVQGKGHLPPELNFSRIRQLLKKSVATLCAHIGFDTTTDTVLDTLTDVVHEYCRRVCRLLRTTVDREAITGHTGYVDVLEQVFQEIGLGSTTALHFFYQTRVIGYHDHVLRTCQLLTDEYEKLRAPEIKPIEEIKSVKVKEEPVSEIQFPVTEEVEDGHPEPTQIPLQLEELQGALQNIEPETSTTLKDEESMKWPPGQSVKKENTVQAITPNLDPDEEIINVSDSPTPSTSGDIDISQGIPSVAVSDTLSPGTESSRIGKPPKKKKKKT